MNASDIMPFLSFCLLCSYLLQDVNEMLAQLAKRKLDPLIAETMEAQFKLESSPSTTAELAEYIIFLDQIQERVRSTFLIVTLYVFLINTLS